MFCLLDLLLGSVRHFLKGLDLCLQILHLNLDERSELCIKLVNTLAVQAILLVPPFDLRVVHHFLLGDRLVGPATFLSGYGGRRFVIDARHGRLLVFSAPLFNVYASGHSW